MLMKVVNKEVLFDHSNDYYDKLLNRYTKHEGSKVLGWWLTEEYFYYSCEVKGEGAYKGGTPLILIDRTKQYLIYDDEFIKWNENTQRDCVEKRPFAIHTLGCDDGHKGWLFTTKEDALLWYKEFSETINTFYDDFESGWEVLHYFSDNQYWLN